MVPSAAPASRVESTTPPDTRTSAPRGAPRARVRSSRRDTEAMLGRASPRNPREVMAARSSTRRILLVACRSRASRASSAVIPSPSSSTRTRRLPPSSTVTATRDAPASRAFSTSSLTTDAGTLDHLAGRDLVRQLGRQPHDARRAGFLDLVGRGRRRRVRGHGVFDRATINCKVFPCSSTRPERTSSLLSRTSIFLPSRIPTTAAMTAPTAPPSETTKRPTARRHSSFDMPSGDHEQIIILAGTRQFRHSGRLFSSYERDLDPPSGREAVLPPMAAYSASFTRAETSASCRIRCSNRFSRARRRRRRSGSPAMTSTSVKKRSTAGPNAAAWAKAAW